MTLAPPISLWDVTSTETDYEGSGDLPDESDVIVVGAGYTGLSTALHCAEAGLSAHVLEAERIGFGGSGRNVGLVNAGVWHPPDAIYRQLGPELGPRFVRRFGAAPDFVFSLIEKHQIRCEVTRTGTIHAAHAPSGTAALRKRYGAWRDLGAPVEMLDRRGMAQATGSAAFFGGLLDHRAGTINPMAYCRGLARAAIGAGARISTGVRVTGLRPDGGGWIVATPRGDMRARAVVLATNAYTDGLWPGLARSYTTISYFQLATAPLGAAVRAILPGRQGLWDTGRVMFSLRRDMQDRLVIGSMGTVLGTAGAGLSRRWAQRQLARLFPALGPVHFEQAWHGRIAMTPDHLPRVHSLAPDLYTPIGYNGRGITTGTVFGAAVAGLLTGDDPAGLPLPMTQLAPVRSAPVLSRLYQTAFTARQFLKSL